MTTILPPRFLLARLSSSAGWPSCRLGPTQQRWALAKPPRFSTSSNRPHNSSPRTARGITHGSPHEQRAAVKVEDSTLVSAGESTPARGPPIDENGGRSRGHDDDDSSSSSSSKGRNPLSSSPVTLSEAQDASMGHLTSTSTHLLRLTLPLPSPEQPVSFVLHPAQPLSYLSRLIAAELPSSLPDVEVVQYRGLGEHGRWSEATDLSDFLRQSANIKTFTIDLLPSARRQSSSGASEFPSPLKSITVTVPSFLSRTQYLRRRLDTINGHLQQMSDLKAECDSLAKLGARRVALVGLGGLLVYWGAVAAATLQWGWDIMEPVTYLIGHGVIVGGYCYWLHHQKQPNYHTVFSRTISSRQAKLYAVKGFDYDRHQRLIAAGRKVREEIGKIADEYGVEWDAKSLASSDPAHQEQDEEGRMSRGKREVQSALKESEKLERKSKVKASLKQDEGKEDDVDEDEEDVDGRPERKSKQKDMVRREWEKLEKSKQDKN